MEVVNQDGALRIGIVEAVWLVGVGEISVMGGRVLSYQCLIASVGHELEAL